MKRIAKAAAVGAAGLGLILGATPANAAAGALVFTGSATTSPTFFPGVGPAVENGTWSFSGTGVGVATTGDAGAASVSANGIYDAGLVQNTLGVLDEGAYCGLSGGYDGPDAVDGEVTIGAATVNLKNVHWLQSLASLIVFQGDTTTDGSDDTGDLVGLVSAIGGSACTTGATSFTVVGAGLATF